MSARRDTSNNYRPTQEVTNGAAHSRPISGPLNTSSNRYIEPVTAYAEATNTVTWTAAENITEFYVTVFADDTTMEEIVTVVGATETGIGATQVEKYVWMVIDAPSEAVATLWLTLAASKTGSTQAIPIPYGVKTGPFTGDSYFSRLDFDCTVDCQVFVEAA